MHYRRNFKDPKPSNPEVKMGASLKALRAIGLFEGLSFLILLGYAMPLKYIWNDPLAVQQVGMAHGVLWILYLGLAGICQLQGFWTTRTSALLVLASLLPAGPFIADFKLLRTVNIKTD